MTNNQPPPGWNPPRSKPPQVPSQKQGSRAGTIAFIAVGLAVAIGFVGMLASRGATGRYPWAQAASDTPPTTRPVPDDVCGFIGEAALRRAVPGATLTGRPGSPDLTTSCKAENQKTGDGFVVDIHRFADAASGTGPARAQGYFDGYCTETYSGGWAPDDPSAPPTPSVGERACGKAGGTAALLVLQGRNVVHIWSTGWDPPVWPSLPGKETELAQHVLQRLETLE